MSRQTVVEWLSAPLAASWSGEATNYNIWCDTVSLTLRTPLYYSSKRESTGTAGHRDQIGFSEVGVLDRRQTAAYPVKSLRLRCHPQQMRASKVVTSAPAT